MRVKRALRAVVAPPGEPVVTPEGIWGRADPPGGRRARVDEPGFVGEDDRLDAVAQVELERGCV